MTAPPPPLGAGRPRAACRRLDGRRRRGGRAAGGGRGQRRRHAARGGARRAARPLLDRLRLRRAASATPYVESDAPNPQSAYGRTKLHAEARGRRRRLDRAQLVAVRLDEPQLRADDARGSARSATRSPSSTTSAAARRTSGTSPRRRASSSSCRAAIWHLAADGDCTWAEFAEAIFEEAGLDCRVRRITTAELGRPAAASRLLGAAERAPRRARAAALARRPPRLPGAAALARRPSA